MFSHYWRRSSVRRAEARRRRYARLKWKMTASMMLPHRHDTSEYLRFWMACNAAISKTNDGGRMYGRCRAHDRCTARFLTMMLKWRQRYRHSSRYSSPIDGRGLRRKMPALAVFIPACRCAGAYLRACHAALRFHRSITMLNERLDTFSANSSLAIHEELYHV